MVLYTFPDGSRMKFARFALPFIKTLRKLIGTGDILLVSGQVIIISTPFAPNDFFFKLFFGDEV